MKRSIFFLFVATLMMVMYSCSSDDEKDSINPTDIIGTWEFVKSYAEVEANPTELKEYIEKDWLYEPSEYSSIDVYEFRNDGTGTEYSKTYLGEIKYPEEFTYVIKGNNLIITDERYKEEDEWDLSVSNNLLTLKWDDLQYGTEDYDKMFPNGKITKLVKIEVFKKK